MKIQPNFDTIKNTAKSAIGKLPGKETGKRAAFFVKTKAAEAKDYFVKNDKAKKALVGVGIGLGILSAVALACKTFVRSLESKFFHIKEKFDGMNFGQNDQTDEIEGLEDFTLKTKSGGSLSVWEMNPYDSDEYVVCCLGFGCPKNHPQAIESYKELIDKGYGVIAFDYLGWGESSGDELTEKGTKESVDTVFNYLHGKGIENDNINLIGHSLGCGVAAGYAKNHPVENLVLINPFNKLQNMVKVWLDVIDAPRPVKKALSVAPAKIIPLKNQYNNEKALKHIDCPTLIVHSTDDTTIPVEIAHRLYHKTEKNSNIHYQEFAAGGHELSEEKVGAVLDFICA